MGTIAASWAIWSDAAVGQSAAAAASADRSLAVMVLRIGSSQSTGGGDRLSADLHTLGAHFVHTRVIMHTL